MLQPRQLMSAIDDPGSVELYMHKKKPEWGLALFVWKSPKGFGSDEWQQAYRGAEYPRVKKHVDPLISDAHEQLSLEECDRLIAANESATIWTRAMDILKQGDLVTPAKLKKFASVDLEAATKLGAALRERLYSDEGERGRFLTFQRAGFAALGEELSWGLVTAIPALFAPNADIVVRPTSAKEFLKQLELEADVPKIPQYPWYRRLRELHNEVRERLDAEGFAAEDLMDVHLFLKVTLARASRERLDVLLNAARNARMGE